MPDKISPSQVTTALILWLGPALLCCSGSYVRAADDWTFSWHTSEVTSFAFTPDGTKLISTSLKDDRVSAGAATKTSSDPIGADLGIITGARSHAVAISPDGGQVAISAFRNIAAYDLKSSEQLWKVETPLTEYSPPFVFTCAFSPDGKRLATSGASSKVGGRHGYKGGLIIIRDVQSGRELHRFDILSHASESIAFSPDGKLLAAGTFGAGGELPEPGELRVWDAATWKLLNVWKAKDSVGPFEDQYSATGIAFSPNSRTIAIAGSDSNVRIWDVATGKIRRELRGHRKGVRRVAFSPDGQTIASAGLDRTVRVWNAASGKQINALEIDVPRVNAVAFSPDGKFLVAGGGDFLRKGEIRMWRMHDHALDPDERR